MHWLVSVETRLTPHLHDIAETFPVGDGQAVLRMADGDALVVHNATWRSYAIRLPEHKELRHCRIVSAFPKRAYSDTDDVYSDESVHTIVHGTDCARSLWFLVHQGEFIDPNFPTCQRMAAGGALLSIHPDRLTSGQW